MIGDKQRSESQQKKKPFSCVVSVFSVLVLLLSLGGSLSVYDGYEPIGERKPAEAEAEKNSMGEK